MKNPNNIQTNVKHSILTISNLKCLGCVNSILSRVQKINGVHSVSIDLEKKEIDLTYDDSDILDTVRSELNSMGYPDMAQSNRLTHKAKSYISCMIGRTMSPPKNITN